MDTCYLKLTDLNLFIIFGNNLLRIYIRQCRRKLRTVHQPTLFFVTTKSRIYFTYGTKFIGGRNKTLIMGILRLVILQVSCINSKLSFLNFLYTLQYVNENWLVEENSAPCIQYIPQSSNAVRSVLITDTLLCVTSAINRLHITDVSVINKVKFQAIGPSL